MNWMIWTIYIYIKIQKIQKKFKKKYSQISANITITHFIPTIVVGTRANARSKLSSISPTPVSVTTCRASCRLSNSFKNDSRTRWPVYSTRQQTTNGTWVKQKTFFLGRVIHFTNVYVRNRWTFATHFSWWTSFKLFTSINMTPFVEKTNFRNFLKRKKKSYHLVEYEFNGAQ